MEEVLRKEIGFSDEGKSFDVLSRGSPFPKVRFYYVVAAS